jgi:exonuclease III
MDTKTIIVGEFNTPFSPIDRPSRQKINKETLELKDTVNQMDLTDIYRTLYPIGTEYTFFSAAHETLSKIVYIIGHKTNLKKYNKIEMNVSH